MKPQSFEYHAPRGVEEVLGLLAERGDAAKVLAGGQSLVPMMNLRLARPELLIDINRVVDLGAVEADGRQVRAGALARHRDLEGLPVGDALAALLSRTARLVAHPPIRARGTVCGSLAHADPAAEWPLVGLALDARVTAVSQEGAREISVGALLDAPFSTTLEPTEMISEVVFTGLKGSWGGALVEQSRSAGSFAELAAAVVLEVQDDRVGQVRVGVAGAAGRPLLLSPVAEALRGRPVAAAPEEAAAAVHDALAGRAEDYARGVLASLVSDAVGQAMGQEVRWRSA